MGILGSQGFGKGGSSTPTPTSGLQEVTDVSNVTSNNVIVTKPTIGSTSVIGGTISNIESATNNASILSSLWLQVQNLINGFRTRLSFPVTPTQDNNITLPNKSGTIALLSDIVSPPPLTNEQIQDSAFAILTDTPTIDLTYDDVANQVTANVIDNSINNTKVSDMPANSVKVNRTGVLADPQDYNIPIDTVLGRDVDINSGNMIGIPIVRSTIGQVTLVNGVGILFNTRINTASIAIVTPTNTGVLSSVPLRVTCTAGQCEINNGQLGDNAVINVLIYF